MPLVAHRIDAASLCCVCSRLASSEELPKDLLAKLGYNQSDGQCCIGAKGVCAPPHGPHTRANSGLLDRDQRVRTFFFLRSLAQVLGMPAQLPVTFAMNASVLSSGEHPQLTACKRSQLARQLASQSCLPSATFSPASRASWSSSCETTSSRAHFSASITAWHQRSWQALSAPWVVSPQLMSLTESTKFTGDLALLVDTMRYCANILPATGDNVPQVDACLMGGHT